MTDENCLHNLCAGVYYECNDCVPDDCDGKNCGVNGCGGSCGSCNSLISECNPLGQCVCFPTISCDDGKACTTGSCDPQVGCVYANVLDGEACPSDGVCQGGVCTYEGCNPQGIFVTCSDAGSTSSFETPIYPTVTGAEVVIGIDPNDFSFGTATEGSFLIKLKIGNGVGNPAAQGTHLDELTVNNECGPAWVALG
ncbi:MAG TPA: hypothetical protein EYN66_06360 [Myxococcales bacterium]|nr:hypothetical protein [Myxococcales bacterium]